MEKKKNRAARVLSRIVERGLRPWCSVILVAAGRSERMMGTEKVTALLEGKPTILRAAEPFEKSRLVDEIILVAREDLKEETARILREGGITKFRGAAVGGNTRTESVGSGLSLVNKKAKLVAIHDAARPLVSVTVLEEAIREAGKYCAAAPAVPVTDTIKVVEKNVVQNTPDRSRLMAVQTPQVFSKDLLQGALANAERKGLKLTDDCSALEAIGVPVHLTRGDRRNLKITTPEDIWIARMILRREERK